MHGEAINLAGALLATAFAAVVVLALKWTLNLSGAIPFGLGLFSALAGLVVFLWLVDKLRW